VPADSDRRQFVACSVVVHRAHGDLQIVGDLGRRHHVVLFRTHAMASARFAPWAVVVIITQKAEQRARCASGLLCEARARQRHPCAPRSYRERHD